MTKNATVRNRCSSNTKKHKSHKKAQKPQETLKNLTSLPPLCASCASLWLYLMASYNCFAISASMPLSALYWAIAAGLSLIAT